MTYPRYEKDNLPHPFAYSVDLPRVLLTGFQPFNGNRENVSEEVVRRFSQSGFEGVELSTMVLSVDEKGSRKCSEILSLGDPLDAIVHLGLSESREKVSLEMLAKNLLDMPKPDNSGRMIRGSKIVQNAPDSLKITAPIHVLDEEFEHDERVVWSEDAGGFVCNETLFRTLEAKDTNDTKIIFVHLPNKSYINISDQAEIVSRVIKCLSIKPLYRVVGALLNDSKGRILACRRPEGDAWSGWWEFPGGKIEEGELQEEALVREIEEELGISVIPHSCVAEISHDYGDRDVELFIWKCETVDPSTIFPSEHDEIKWVSQDELINLKWLPADLPLIQEWTLKGIP
tara:strand:+ start:17928 stop:18956 length:1029 start_codon:yes stop_codon:yes gene_type:complete